MRRLLRLCPLVLFVVPAALAAQAHGHFDRLGRVVFPVSCNAVAQQRFEHAMAVLHSFWWEQGGGAFGAVLEADSTCAMAHWGLALNAWGNPFAGGPGGAALAAGAASAERAAARGAPTIRERGFLAAVTALYRDHATVTNAARLRAYSDTLARVYRDHPADPEVAIYYALSLVATASPTDTTFARQKQAAAILNPLFVRFPEHPGLAHYIIHSNDSPRLAHLGLDAARRYAQIAPAAPHAQHMPSHIFVRLGMWDETVASNWKSYDAGVTYAKAQQLGGVQYHEFHALDYAVYGYLQRGQDREARRVGAMADTATVVRAPSQLLGGYNRLAIKARVPLERGDWAGAAKFPLPATGGGLVVVALARFTRAIGAARSGASAQAEMEVRALDSIATVLEHGNDPYWARVVGIKGDAARAWMLYARGDTTNALRFAREAADREDVTEKHPVTPGELLPARELEADLLLATGRYAEARAAYRKTLEREPGRARSTFGAARAAELAGDAVGARQGYREFLALMEKADGDRAEIGLARKAVASRD